MEAGWGQQRRCDGGQVRSQRVALSGQEQAVGTGVVSGCPQEGLTSVLSQGSKFRRSCAVLESAKDHGWAAGWTEVKMGKVMYNSDFLLFYVNIYVS